MPKALISLISKPPYMAKTDAEASCPINYVREPSSVKSSITPINTTKKPPINTAFMMELWVPNIIYPNRNPKKTPTPPILGIGFLWICLVLGMSTAPILSATFFM